METRVVRFVVATPLRSQSLMLSMWINLVQASERVSCAPGELPEIQDFLAAIS